MQITVRTLLASIAASAIFGGAVGALATAATSSQASPQAVAAAVQKVSDPAIERYLRLMVVRSGSWESTDSNTSEITEQLKALITVDDSIENNAYTTCWDAASALQRPDCRP